VRVTKIVEISFAAPNRTTDAMVNWTAAKTPPFGECRNRTLKVRRSLASDRVSNPSGGAIADIVVMASIPFFMQKISDNRRAA
jgi:hypothetical protein